MEDRRTEEPHRKVSRPEMLGLETSHLKPLEAENMDEYLFLSCLCGFHRKGIKRRKDYHMKNPIRFFAWCILNDMLPEDQVFSSLMRGETPADHYIVNAAIRLGETVCYYEEQPLILEDLGYTEIEE